MEIEYKTKEIEHICTDYKYCKKKYGETMTTKIFKRIIQITQSPSMENLFQGPGKCHALNNNRSGQYSFHLVEPYRLIFDIHQDGIIYIRVIEIVDYHKEK